LDDRIGLKGVSFDLTVPIVPEEQHFILSSLPPGPGQKRLALGIVLGLTLALYVVTAGPFGGIQVGVIHSFVAIYATATFVTESITAVLLYTQFSILRSRAILVIASGYLFTALLIVPYVLAFPGVLAPHGLIGGVQTTAQLYLLWHCGFPLFVIGYALSKDADPGRRVSQGQVGSAILRSVAATTAAAAAATFVSVGEAVLPRIMRDEYRFVAEWPYVVGAPVAAVCTLALAVLWVRRRSILDLFLMVVVFAYLIEIPPHYYPFPARFSTGWYAVRLTSLLSSSVVLVVLLYEISAMYGGLLDAVLRQRRERQARLMTGDVVAASIAHEIKQPLTAMITSADAGFRFLDRSSPNLERAKEALKRIATDGHRAGVVVDSIRANFKNDDRTRTSLDVNELIEEVLSLERGALQKYRILVQAETAGQLPEVRGSRVQLQQVLVNLITNAIDSMAAGDEPRLLCVKSEAYEHDGVMVSVADIGTGISPQDVDRVFNPLFTTKPDGMGMGLPICRAIIEAHEGRLWVSPNVPRGAVFQFTLRGGNSASAGV
jgi:signal transduction histidine kinase